MEVSQEELGPQSMSLVDIMNPKQMAVENLMRALSLTEITPRQTLRKNDIGEEVESWVMTERMAITGKERDELKSLLIELITNYGK